MYCVRDKRIIVCFGLVVTLLISLLICGCMASDFLGTWKAKMVTDLGDSPQQTWVLTNNSFKITSSDGVSAGSAQEVDSSNLNDILLEQEIFGSDEFFSDKHAVYLVSDINNYKGDNCVLCIEQRPNNGEYYALIFLTDSVDKISYNNMQGFYRLER